MQNRERLSSRLGFILLSAGCAIGGGNVWRGRRGAAMRMGTVAADQMGMLGTLQNCLYMRDTLAHMGAKATVMTAVDMPRFAEPYNTVKALELLDTTAQTPSPDGGEIVLENGSPNGIFFDNAMNLILLNIPAPDRDEIKGMIRSACASLNSYGITS